jgi:hypothetical protein
MTATPAGRTSRRAAAGVGSLLVAYLLLELVAGAPASPLVPGLPVGTGVPRWAARGAEWLGLDRLSRTGLTVLAWGLLAFAVVAFGVVVLEARAHRLSVRAAVVGSAVALGLAVAGPVLLSRDVTSYAAYGRIVAVHDANPYEVPPSSFPADPYVAAASPQWVDDTTVYGPAFTLVSAAVAGTWSDSPSGTLAAFRALAGVAVLGAVLLVARAAARWRPDRGPLAAVALGLNPVVVLHTVGGGHNDALVALGLAGALALAAPSDGRPEGPRALAVTLVLVLVTLVKSVAGIALLVWWWRAAESSPPGRRVRVAASHVALAVAVALALFAPFLSSMRALESVVAAASREGWASGPGFVVRGIRRFGRGTAVDVLAGIVVALFLAAFVWVVVRWVIGRRPVQNLRDLPDRWGTTMILFALSVPYLLPWYAAWLLPFVGLLASWPVAVLGLAAAALLALTGVPAEAGSTPGLWHGMVLVVHVAVAPLMLVALVGVSLAVRRRPVGPP